MKPMHTPGPWKIRPSGNIVAGLGERENYVTVCTPIMESMFVDADTKKANVRLIAAAPELLAALQECIKYMPTEVISLANLPLADDVRIRPEFSAYFAARAAIAKATGQQSD